MENKTLERRAQHYQKGRNTVGKWIVYGLIGIASLVGCSDKNSNISESVIKNNYVPVGNYGSLARTEIDTVKCKDPRGNKYNWIIKTEYDSLGRRIREIGDVNGDGQLIYINTWGYDSLGRNVRCTKDINGDGKPNYVETFEYDSLGNAITRKIDADGDGDIDAIDLDFDGDIDIRK